MPVISQSALAKSIGKSQQYIAKLIKAGKIPGNRNGVDTDDPIIQAFIAHKKAGDAKAKSKPGKAATPTGTTENIDSLDRWGLEKRKLAEQIKRMELDTKIKRGEFVSNEIVKSVFSKLLSIHNNEFLRTCDKLAPVIAGIVENNDAKVISRISSEIERENYRVLERVQKQMVKYLGESNSSIRKKSLIKK